MGLSASQARLLMLTGRQNDLEQRSMNISEKRLQVTQQTDQLYNQQNSLSQEMANLQNQLNQAQQGQSSGGSTSIGSALGSMVKKFFGCSSSSNNSNPEADAIQAKLNIDQSKNDVIQNNLNKLEDADKRMQIQLQQIDTQHKAVQTEIDSVKKVIDKNIQSTFKILG